MHIIFSSSARGIFHSFFSGTTAKIEFLTGGTVLEKSLSRYLIVTDIDDTLLPHEGEIPKRNLDAIYRFQKKGGKFTFATAG